MPYAGEIAALGTALCWVFTSIFFAESGKRIGSFAVNNIRLLMAVTIYIITLSISQGRLFPSEISTYQVLVLGISGLIGLTLGDGLGFKALVMIGPRLTTLMWSTAPIFAIMTAWFFLGEKLSWLDGLGIVLALIGIVIVVLNRRFSGGPLNALAADHPDQGKLWQGILLGIGAAVGQAVGLILAKEAMVYSGEQLPAMESSFIRMLFALAGIWVLATVRGQLRKTIGATRNIGAMSFSAGGAIMGPFLGVTLSLVAVRLIDAGVAATLNAMTPIMVLPAVIIIYKERVSVYAWAGAALAVGGVTLIFLG